MVAMIERLIGLGNAYEARRPCALLGAERPRLRRAQQARPRGDDRRRARRGRALQARSRRLRAVEAERRGSDRLGFAMGARPAGLAHRMLGDDRARISARRSTSTAAASTSSSRITRTRSRRAAARTAARRSRATGCTTASSTWAARRCRSASATSSRRRSCWRRDIKARRCGWRCCSAHYRQPLPWTEASLRRQRRPRPALSRGWRSRSRGEVDEGVLEALATI